MFILRNDQVKVVVPGYLVSYHGEAMMPEYGRYMATLPFFFIANIISLFCALCALFVGGNSSAFMAFSIYMLVFSARLFTQQLVRVRIENGSNEAAKAPMVVNVNTAVSGITLAIIGIKYSVLAGEFDGIFFKIAGIMMIALAVVCIVALRSVKKSH